MAFYNVLKKELMESMHCGSLDTGLALDSRTSPNPYLLQHSRVETHSRLTTVQS